MKTYKKIQEEYKQLYGRSIETCWIADVKRSLGLTTRKAYNRISDTSVKYSCLDEHKARIKGIILGK